MPDEHESQAPAEETGQAAIEAPEGSGQATEPDDAPSEFFSEDKAFDPAALPDEIREQYLSMRGDYSRKTAELAEQRREAEQAIRLQEVLADPETRDEFLAQAFGYEFEEPEDDEEGEFEAELPPEIDSRLSGVEQFIQEQQQAAQRQEAEAVLNSYMDDSMAALEKRTGREFDQDEREAIEDLAVMGYHLSGGQQMPDLEAAYERLYAGIFPKEKSRVAKSKDAPHVSPSGSSAAHQPDLRDPAQRREYILSKIGADAPAT